MDDIDQLKINLIKYYALKENVSNLSRVLSSAATAYEDMETAVSDSFVVDNDKPNVCNKINENREKIEETSKYLKNTILPEIDRKVFLIKNKIAADAD